MEEVKRILITGVGSGLGKHCLQYFHGFGFSRQTTWKAINELAIEKPYDAIIHVAFNREQTIDNTNLYPYLNDTLLLTQRLTTLPHKKFIFISSADVYPKTTDIHHEDEKINLNDVNGFYGLAKLMSESIILNETENHLIIRPTALLGRYAKKNSLIKIISGEKIGLTLAPQSIFNYVLHADVCQFIEYALAKNLMGIYNLAVASNVSLGKIADLFNSPVIFGDYLYSIGHIANDKIVAIQPKLKRSSIDSVHQFLGELKGSASCKS